MKNKTKSDSKRKLRVKSFTLSECNIAKIEQNAKIETRGNSSLWLDQNLDKLFAKEIISCPPTRNV